MISFSLYDIFKIRQTQKCQHCHLCVLREKLTDINLEVYVLVAKLQPKKIKAIQGMEQNYYTVHLVDTKSLGCARQKHKLILPLCTALKNE